MNYILSGSLKQKRLTVITFYPTERCNLNCSGCLNAISRNKILSRNKSDLSFKTFKKAIDEFGVLKPFLYFSGGEPTLNNDIFRMISYTNEKRFITSMVTNGLTLDEKYQDILNCGLRFITISIDGFEKDHDEMRGMPGAFDKTLNGVKKLISSRSDSIHIKVNITINKNNYSYLFNLVKFLFSLGVDEVSLQHFSFFNPETIALQEECAKKYALGVEVMGAGINSKSYLSKKQISVLEKELAKIRRSEFNVDLNETPVDDIRKYYEGKSPSTKSKCRRVNNELGIRANGDVEICPGYVLGNIRNDRIIDLFRGKKAEHLRNILKRNLIPACYRCCRLNYSFK